MNYLYRQYWEGVTSPSNLLKINLLSIFVVFMSIDGFSQEKAIGSSANGQNETSVNHNEATNVVLSDSLKRVEAKRIYLIPVERLKENQEKINSNPPPTIPKKK